MNVVSHSKIFILIFHGQDPDFSIRDMYNAVASGDFPKYTMYIQVRILIQPLSLTVTSDTVSISFLTMTIFQIPNGVCK